MYWLKDVPVSTFTSVMQLHNYQHAYSDEDLARPATDNNELFVFTCPSCGIQQGNTYSRLLGEQFCLGKNVDCRYFCATFAHVPLTFWNAVKYVLLSNQQVLTPYRHPMGNQDRYFVSRCLYCACIHCEPLKSRLKHIMLSCNCGRRPGAQNSFKLTIEELDTEYEAGDRHPDHGRSRAEVLQSCLDTTSPVDHYDQVQILCGFKTRLPVYEWPGRWSTESTIICSRGHFTERRSLASIMRWLCSEIDDHPCSQCKYEARYERMYSDLLMKGGIEREQVCKITEYRQDDDRIVYLCKRSQHRVMHWGPVVNVSYCHLCYEGFPLPEWFDLESWMNAPEMEGLWSRHSIRLAIEQARSEGGQVLKVGARRLLVKRDDGEVVAVEVELEGTTA